LVRSGWIGSETPGQTNAERRPRGKRSALAAATPTGEVVYVGTVFLLDEYGISST